MKRGQKIQHPHAHEFYHYLLGPRYDPGAQAEIFQPSFTNMRFAAKIGRGLEVRVPFRPLQTGPQVWYSPTVRRVGLPTQAGQLRSAPLMDPTI